MATLKEIASKLGVSITTVSRVLNNDKSLNVSDEIRKKVLDTARSMQYKTPRNRLRLKSENELKIALIHWYDQKGEIDDPYYLQIRRGVEVLAAKSNIRTVLLYKEHNDYNYDMLDHIDGVIAIGKFSDEQINKITSKTKHIVFVDSSPDINQFDSVVIDFKQAVKDILSYLISRGYKKIGYLGGIETIAKDKKLGERREQAFKEYLEERQLLEEKHIHIGQFTSESGYQLMKKALDIHPAEVYFCANDNIAIGAMRAIHEKGLRIPDDIGIFGFNDSPNCEYTFPPLSTLRVNTEFMGEQALKSLLDTIDGKELSYKKVIPTELIIRKSIK